MSRVTWSPENDRKLLLELMTPASKDIPINQIAALFPGATPKSIIERIAKLRREKKAASASTTSTPPGSSPTPSKAVRQPRAPKRKRSPTAPLAPRITAEEAEEAEEADSATETEQGELKAGLMDGGNGGDDEEGNKDVKKFKREERGTGVKKEEGKDIKVEEGG